MSDSEVTTTISVNGGPQIPIDLANPDDPGNAEAKEAIAGVVRGARGPIIAADELRLLIERIERLTEEKQAMADDIRDVYAEAKARGYCAKTMRKVVALRKMETHQREEAAAILDTYCAALGIQGVLL